MIFLPFRLAPTEGALGLKKSFGFFVGLIFRESSWERQGEVSDEVSLGKSFF